MKKSLRKLAAMEVPSENEARAEEGKETFTEDNPTGSGEVKCRKCGQKSSAEEAEGGCPNCGSRSLAKTDLGKKVNPSNPRVPTKDRVLNQDRVWTFFRGTPAIKHGPTDDGGSLD